VLEAYLENPDHDGEQRQKTFARESYSSDGKAGERIAGFIASNLRD
jgi:hypothetical protein